MRTHKQQTPFESMAKLNFLSVATILLASPLPKAGVLYWWATILVLLLLPNLFSSRFVSKLINTSNSSIKYWLYLYFVFSLLILLQLWLIPHLVDWNAPVIQFDQQVITNKPINTKETIESWGLFTSYWFFAYLVSQLNRQQIKFAFVVILLSAAFQIFYGLLFTTFEQQMVLGWWKKEHYIGFTTGTFVNKNHYANYLAMAIPLLIAGATYWLTSKKNKHSTFTLRLVLTITCLLIVLAFTALIQSQSRAGFIFGSLGCLVFSAFIVKKHWQRRYFPIFTVIFVLVIIIGTTLLSVVNYENMLARLARISGYDLRWQTWENILNMPASVLLLGSGAGTFFDIFLQYSPTNITKTVFYAHNDYLQFLLEYGILGITLLIHPTYLWLKSTLKWRSFNILQYGALTSICVMLLHSSVDFSLHIPANALLFFFALGCLSNQSLLKRRRR